MPTTRTTPTGSASSSKGWSRRCPTGSIIAVGVEPEARRGDPARPRRLGRPPLRRDPGRDPDDRRGGRAEADEATDRGADRCRSLTPRREFATEVVARLPGAGFQAPLGRRLRPRPDPRAASRPTTTWPPTPRPSRSWACSAGPSRSGSASAWSASSGPTGAGEVEVATFRSDGDYLDGRRPESVQFGDARLDAERRDFTINGMFLDPLDRRGPRLRRRPGRPRRPGPPGHRRPRRPVRRGQAPPAPRRPVRRPVRPGDRARGPGPRSAAMADQVRVVAAERIAQELRRMLVHPIAVPGDGPGHGRRPDRGRPPAAGPDQGAVPGQAGPARRATSGTTSCSSSTCSRPTRASRWPSPRSCTTSASPTPRASSNGRTTFHNHEQVGRAIADRLCRDLKLANAERER